MMHKHRVVWNDDALADLNTLPKNESLRIKRKVDEHLAIAPDKLGEPLQGSFKGFHRYRVENYRVIYEIYKEAVVINIIRVGHRKDVYED